MYYISVFKLHSVLKRIYIFNLLKRAPQPLTEPIVRITNRNLPIVAICCSGSGLYNCSTVRCVYVTGSLPSESERCGNRFYHES